MIRVTQLSKAFGAQTLFSDAQFFIGDGERIGLVGRNGHGKSTLFRILQGKEEPDSGTVAIPKGYTIGHLEQHLSFTESSVLEEVMMGVPEEERIETYRGARLLMGLGFSEADLAKSPALFSGGYQIRVELAKLLLSSPNLLLLDEPTNYLDIVSVRWLERELQQWPHELIVISHDRHFMDSVSSHTMGIHRGQVKKVEGDTDKYYQLLAEEEELYEKSRVQEERQKEELKKFIMRFRAKASTASRAKSKQRELERLGNKDKLRDIESLDFSFKEAPFHGKHLAEVHDISFGYSPDKPLFSSLSFTLSPGSRVGVIGKNGRGKSTLLRTIAGELTPLSGSIRFHEKTSLGYLGQTNIDRLTPALTIAEEILSANEKLSRTEVRSIAGSMMFSGDAADKKISVLSGGEKSRVLLSKILATPTNLLLLDEPTNHLDFQSVEALIETLDIFSGAVVVVTHNEDVLRRIATTLVVFDSPEQAVVFHGTYDEFLADCGWSDEEDEAPIRKKKKEQKNGAPPPPSAALKKEIELLEKRIESVLEALRKNTEALETASYKGDGHALSDLSKTRATLEKEESSLFEKLEILYAQIDNRTLSNA
jgi:ATP-binding cassette, subfamily F, member 3